MQQEANIVFLALTIWREARGEPEEVKAGVAYSIINRVAHPGWWGKTMFGVLFKKWQYSSMTAPGDPNLIAWPADTDVAWGDCLRIAMGCLDGTIPNPVAEANSYVDISIKAPDWATETNFVVQIGKIKFYKV